MLRGSVHFNVLEEPEPWWLRLLRKLWRHILGNLKAWLIGGGATAIASALLLWVNSNLLHGFFSSEQIATGAAWLAGIIVTVIVGKKLADGVPKDVHAQAIDALKNSAPAGKSGVIETQDVG